MFVTFLSTTLSLCPFIVTVDGVDPNSPIANIMSHLLKQIGMGDHTASNYLLSLDGGKENENKQEVRREISLCFILQLLY